MRRIQLAKYWPLFWYLLYFDLWNQTVALSDFSLYSKVFVLCMQLCFPVTQHHFCRASFAFTEWVPSRQRVVTGVRPPPVHIVHRPPPLTHVPSSHYIPHFPQMEDDVEMELELEKQLCMAREVFWMKNYQPERSSSSTASTSVITRRRLSVPGQNKTVRDKNLNGIYLL